MSSSTSTEPSAMQSSTAKRVSLTLIVATTPSLGIGFKNALPWPALKSEMAYFARVTKRVPGSNSASTAGQASSVEPTAGSRHSTLCNAVIMGRSTYDSIPKKFRPLKDRLNIVLTRASPDSETRKRIESEAKEGAVEGPLVVGSITEALEKLKERGTSGSGNEDDDESQLGRAFVIGGAEVYAQALKMEECDRVLRTRIEKDFECDVFFPVRLGESDGEGSKWKKATKEDLDSWVGETVPGGLQEQGDITWEFEMWTKSSAGQSN